ncbi:hypothetical protein [Roseateles sp. P5_D6]
MPATSAASYIWQRNFGGNPLASASGTTMNMFDAAEPVLTQYTWMNQFATGGGIFWIGPQPQSGLFLGTTAPALKLQVGLVPHAIWPMASSSVGTLDSPNCRPSNGAYVVHDVAYAADGSLSSLAADFTAGCSLGYAAYVNGAIRYRSAVAAALDRSFAVAGADRTLNEGESLRLDGSLSWNPASRLRSIEWAQLSGPSFDLSNCRLGICDTYTPLVAKGGAQAKFRLTAVSESGKSATADLTITVRSWQDTQSRADIWGSGHVSSGSDLRMSESDGVFDVPVKGGTEAIFADQTAERIRWVFNPNGNAAYDSMELVLSNTAGLALTPGSYAGNLRAGFEPGARPAASASYAGHGCNSSEWEALVAEMDRDPTQLTTVNRGAVTLHIGCTEGGGELQGSYLRLWLRYTPVSPPVVRVTAPTTATAGQAVMIQDAGSTTTNGGEWLRTCKQIYGQASASIEFLANGACKVTPSASTPNNSKVVVAYEVLDGKGQSGVALAELLVTGGPAAAVQLGGKPAFQAATQPARRTAR